MTKTEQNRVLAWRLKVLREASAAPRNVARTCRNFGLSRKAFYKWKARYEAQGEAGLCDWPRAPHRSPRATPRRSSAEIAAGLSRPPSQSIVAAHLEHVNPGRSPDNRRRHPVELPNNTHARLRVECALTKRPPEPRKMTSPTSPMLRGSFGPQMM